MEDLAEITYKSRIANINLYILKNFVHIYQVHF